MDQLDEMGYRAWNEYYTQLQIRYGLGGRGHSAYFNHQHHRNFRKIAEICVTHKFDITDFVVHAFDLLSKNHKYITPKDLTTPDLVDKYREYCRGSLGDVKRYHILQLHRLLDLESRFVPKPFPNEEALLMESDFSFMAWFRVLHPKPFNTTLCERYGEAAWLALREDHRLLQYMRTEYTENTAELERKYGPFPLCGGIA